MSNVVDLVIDRERLRDEVARKPEERLAEVEHELERRAAKTERERAANRRAFINLCDAYVDAQAHALDAARRYVDRVDLARSLRQRLDEVARLDGARVPGEVLPESISVMCGRALSPDEETRRTAQELQTLRADLRIAAALDF